MSKPDTDLAAWEHEARDAKGRWTSGGRGVTKVALKESTAPFAFQNGKRATTPQVTPPKPPARGGGITAFMTPKVQPKPPAYVVNGRPFDSGGHALPTAKVHLKPAMVPSEEGAKQVAQKHTRGPGADLIPAGSHFGDVNSWYTDQADETDKDNLSTDLGLNPKFRELSVPELRKRIKHRETAREDRKAFKEELAKRVSLAKQVAAEKKGFTNRLAKALEDKPEDADLAPQIGETLAEHPNLGALAHIWDRLRLTGYNFKKKVREGEFTDELPRILARTAFTILAAFLMIHLGTAIPGLDFATASGD